jgi:thioredoxin 1
MMPNKPIEVTDANFEEVILEADVPAMVDLWAAWCGPCRMVAPAVENLAQEFDGRAVVAKVDVDSNRLVAQKYGVMSIPTMLFFKDGEEVDRVIGVQPEEVLREKLEALL